MKKWLKSFFIFLVGFWFCGKLDFISLLGVLDCIVAHPHTKRKHATCVLDLILELASHPVFSQNAGLQTSGGLLSHLCSGFLGSSLLCFALEHPVPDSTSYAIVTVAGPPGGLDGSQVPPVKPTFPVPVLRSGGGSSSGVFLFTSSVPTRGFPFLLVPSTMPSTAVYF